MDEVRSDDAPALIQAQRFELVDEDGRTRAVLGDVGGPDEYVPGLELWDADGHQRTMYALFSFGPMINFASGGNEVLILGVSEDQGLTAAHPEFDPTAFVSLCDGDGQRRWQVAVHHGGGVEVTVDHSVEPEL